MKILLINGSPKREGNTYTALSEVAKTFEAAQDAEGMQTMRQLARNMAFLVKSIRLGKEKYGLPEHEEWNPTNFIR